MTRVSGDWLTNTNTQKVLGIFDGSGQEIYFVGGCVRDALLDKQVSDIDLATSARPEAVVELADAAGLKAIPTGIEHGTITVVSGGIAHEITTFRCDKTTDGRRAKVSFSHSILEDAGRRDFTFNALYADRFGNVVDPIGGLQDLQDRRVRFIGDANARIREDYLRILRFFRFQAHFGDPQIGMDADASSAIASNIAGLEILPAERVGAEMKKLLSAPDPASAIAAMQATGVLAAILPGAESGYLAALVHLDQDEPVDPIRRLVAVGGNDVHARLRLSRQENQRLMLLRDLVGNNMTGKVAGYRYGTQVAVDAEHLRCAFAARPFDTEYRADAKTGSNFNFPVSAKDLMPQYQGVELGKKLNDLEQRWINSNFELTRSQLLS